MPELCEFCRKIAEENEKLHATVRKLEEQVSHWKARYDSMWSDAGVARAMLRDEQRYNSHLKKRSESKK